MPIDTIVGLLFALGLAVLSAVTYIEETPQREADAERAAHMHMNMPHIDGEECPS